MPRLPKIPEASSASEGGQPRLEVYETADAVAERASAIMADIIAAPDAVIGLATGQTPLPVYEKLRARADAGMVTSHLRCFTLDEYYGIPPEHEASYHSFLKHQLFDPINLPEQRWSVPNGMSDYIAETNRYEDEICKAGGIDLQLLGIGRNGHIGFNEPGSDFDSRTRLVALTEDTRRTNTPLFPVGEQVPTHALTMGIATILEARCILMIVTGESKSRALADMLKLSVSTDRPASALRLHKNTIILADQAAASLLD